MTVHSSDVNSRPADDAGVDNPVPEDPLSPHEETDVPSAEVAIATADPTLRLAARRNSLVLAVVISDLIVRFVEFAGRLREHSGNAPAYHEFNVLNNDLYLASDLARALDRDLARDLTRALNRELDHPLARRLARAFYYLDRRSNLVRARMLVEDLAEAVNRSRSRDRDFDYALGLARNLALALALDHGLGRALVQDRAHDRTLARTLARNLRVRARNLDLGLDLARDLDCIFVGAMSRLLALNRVKGMAGALLKGALDDFTQADLSNTDLASVDLTGVRWSMSTRWPTDIDRDELLRRSRETASRSGIYVVSSPGSGPVHEDVHPRRLKPR